MRGPTALTISTVLALLVCIPTRTGRPGDGERWPWVFPPDDRDRISSHAYPWSAVCKVYVVFPDGTAGEGSAAMVSERFAITAGHVVYDSLYGGYAESVRVVPRYDDGVEPFGSHDATRLFALDGWLSGDSTADLGAIELGTDVGSGTGVFHLGFPSVVKDVTTLNIAGYPADRESGRALFHGTGTALAVEDDELFYAGTLDTYGGQSGAPIWVVIGEDLVLVGVHSGSNAGLFNIGTRLTEDRVKTVRTWGGINAAPVLTDGPFPDSPTAAVGQSITFRVDVTDDDGDDISLTWDFGDGHAGTGPSPRHAYDRAGTFTAVVTADDGYEPTLGQCQVVVPPPLTGIKLRVKLSFRKPDRDSFRFSCCMPVPQVDPGDAVTIDIGGVEKTYVLGQRLTAKTATGKVKAKYRRSWDCWFLKVREKRGDFQSDWADDGLEDRDVVSIGLSMTTHLEIGGQPCLGVTLHDYRGREGKTGKLE